MTTFPTLAEQRAAGLETLITDAIWFAVEGTALPPIAAPPPIPVCAWPRCTRPIHARGLCTTHYSKARTLGVLPRLQNERQSGACAVEGCDRTDLIAHNLCRKHAARQWRNGDPTIVKRRGPPTSTWRCRVEGCDRPYYAKDLCRRHYQQCARRAERHSAVDDGNDTRGGTQPR